MPKTKTLPPELMQAALAGLEAQRQRLTEQIATVQALLGKGRSRAKATVASAPASAPKKRRVTVAARKRMAAAQKKRWAAYRKAKSQA